jgi:hypothetical protein
MTWKPRTFLEEWWQLAKHVIYEASIGNPPRPGGVKAKLYEHYLEEKRKNKAAVQTRQAT